MFKIFFLIGILFFASAKLSAYAYPHQAQLNALTQEILIANKQYKLLYQKYQQESTQHMSYRRSKQYIKIMKELREKSISLIRERNGIIRDKRVYVAHKEQALLNLYAAEDRGPSLQSILKMKGKIRVNIDLSKQRMKIYKGKTLLYSWQVSTAREGYITPVGRYKPYHAERIHYSKLYDNSPMPYSLFFKDGYAIHGTHYVRSLGGTASHGCVRLRTSNAKKLYNMVKGSGYNNTVINVKH